VKPAGSLSIVRRRELSGKAGQLIPSVETYQRRAEIEELVVREDTGQCFREELGFDLRSFEAIMGEIVALLRPLRYGAMRNGARGFESLNREMVWPHSYLQAGQASNCGSLARA
jgi:hypothetical protein